jgi:transposase-like protein
MYSYEDRMKAVKLYIKYDFSAADTVRELGYPNRKMLVRWYEEYQGTGELHRQYSKQPRYTPEQMQAAMDYYLHHGRNVSRTVKAVGYPSRATLREWIDELAPGRRKSNIKRSTRVQFSEDEPPLPLPNSLVPVDASSTNGKRSCSEKRTEKAWENPLNQRFPTIGTGSWRKLNHWINVSVKSDAP